MPYYPYFTLCTKAHKTVGTRYIHFLSTFQAFSFGTNIQESMNGSFFMHVVSRVYLQTRSRSLVRRFSGYVGRHKKCILHCALNVSTKTTKVSLLVLQTYKILVL